MGITHTKKQKISFFSIMSLSAGSCIGAGIFYKNGSILSNNNENIVGVILSWSLAIVAILCMTLTFGEMVSKSKKYENEGVLGWLRFFTSEKLYKGGRNFMFYIYLTTNFFVMPYYCMMSFQDAINVYYSSVLNSSAPPINFMVIIAGALLVMLYFVASASLSKKTGIVQNNILMYMKFIPLAFAAVGGIVLYCLFGQHAVPESTMLTASEGTQLHELLGTWVGFGVIASIPAIFFAFDGFYTPTGSFGELKSPKKGPMALALGVSVVSFIYVMVSVGLLLSNNKGTIIGLEGIITNKGWGITVFIMELLIASASMGIINGFAIYSNDLIKGWIKDESLPFSKAMKRKFNMNKNIGSTIYALIAYTVCFMLFTAIGCFYLDSYATYGKYTDNIYTFCDIIGNWSSLLMFVVIGMPIFGGLIKKMKSNEKKDTSWYKFVIGAFVSLIFIAIALSYQTVECFYNLIIDSLNYSRNAYGDLDNNQTYFIQIVVPQIIKMVTFIVFNAVIFLPSLIKKSKHI